MPESLEEVQFKTCKLKIKDWEHQFTKTNHRKPEKGDIQEASSEIKDAYRAYWTLKKKKESIVVSKDDVWSEKLNKSTTEKLNPKLCRGNFQKICKRIKEKSCILNNKKSIDSPSISMEKQSIPFSESLNDKMHQNDNVPNCSDLTDKDSQLDNMEPELPIAKSTAKISKSNYVYKNIKSINILRSPLNSFSGLRHNLSFDASSLDSDWLERCSEIVLKTSDNDSVISTKKLGSDDDANNEMEIKNKSNDILLPDSQSMFNGFSDVNFNNDNVLDDSMKQHSTDSAFNYKNLDGHSLQDSVQKDINCEKTISGTPIFCLVKEDANDAASSLIDKSHSKGTEIPLEKEMTDDYYRKSKKRKLTKDSIKSSHLERKIAAGTLNDNFVKINIKKKKFSRGHQRLNMKKLKWQKWKNMKKSSEAGSANECSPSACFKCGQIGHWARNCKVLIKDEQFCEANNDDIDDDILPTLEQAAELAKKAKNGLLSVRAVGEHISAQSSVKVEEQKALEKLCLDIESESCNPPSEEEMSNENVKPIFSLTSGLKPIETPVEVFDALNELGYTSFRKGQETAVMRILSGLSTLVVLPTGSGKTLCYQLPAYIYAKRYNCITIVISPLVSLMEDQVTGLAKGLHAVCLHSGMADVKKKAAVQDLNDGKAQILLVSPEAVISGLTYGIPPISFACIDEAHCLSQWSHNFRPSYLQLYKVLTQHMNVKCILGLTATANLSSIKEIMSHLGLENIEESVVGSTGIPPNLHLSVSRDKNKDKALIQLLTGERFRNCSSIIVYCIRRDETERVAAFIRTYLQDHLQSEEPPSKKTKTKSKKRNFLWTAEAYHAGLAPPVRCSIQKKFMSGKVRVVVATIAFGMGLDKRDIHAVLHYNMPKSFESYVQEIGRAGRDGTDSHCHLFLNSEGKDMRELRRHIYSNSTDRYILRKLLKKVFLPCKCKMSSEECSNSVLQGNPEKGVVSQHSNCPKHEIAFSINDAVEELDLKQENILTLLCYLELHSKQWIEVLPPTYATCIIRCYGGAQQLRSLASKSAPVAAAFALDAKKGKKLESVSSYQFQIIEVASLMGWNAGSMKRELKRLEWNDQNRKTGVIIEFTDLAFHLNAPGDLSDDELDDIQDFLHQKVVASEKTEIHNLQSLFSIFTKYSFPHYWNCCDEVPLEYSNAIKQAINKYFEETENAADLSDMNSQTAKEDIDKVDVSDVRSQIRDIIFTNNDQNFTGRAIARIFHGIGSPRYPAEVWGRVRKFWRCLLHVDFNLLIKLANDELKKCK